MIVQSCLRFFHDPIHVFVEPIEQEGEQLLSVVLHIASKAWSKIDKIGLQSQVGGH